MDHLPFRPAQCNMHLGYTFSTFAERVNKFALPPSVFKCIKMKRLTLDDAGNQILSLTMFYTRQKNQLTAVQRYCNACHPTNVPV